MVIQISNPLRGIQAPETSETATNETDLRQLYTYRFCEWNPTGSDISTWLMGYSQFWSDYRTVKYKTL